MLALLLLTTACATADNAPTTPLKDMTCADLLPLIEATQDELKATEKTIANSMDLRTGGGISAQGGSSTGVGIGVGISIGAPINSYRKRKAVLKAEKLREDLSIIKNEAVVKKCY